MLTGFGRGRGDYAYAEESPINRVDPSGLFSNALIARSFGFSGDEEGFQQVINLFLRDSYYSGSLNWPGNMGFLHMLQDATPGSAVVSYYASPWPEYTSVHKLECSNGQIEANPVDLAKWQGMHELLDADRLNSLRNFAVRNSAENRLVQSLWRTTQSGRFLLSPPTTLYTDRRFRASLPDFVFMGALTDAPLISGIDFADALSILTNEAVNLGPVGITAEKMFVVDRYGRTYLTWSGGVEVSWGIPLLELAWGEGYVNWGDDLAASDVEIQNALTGADVSGSVSVGVSVGLSPSSRVFGADFSFGVGLSVEYGLQLGTQIEGWDWRVSNSERLVVSDYQTVVSRSSPPSQDCPQ